MVSSVRTSGFTALLIIFAVVLATASVPMLSGHSPLEAVGPDSTPAIDGMDVQSQEIDSVDGPQDVDSLDDIEAGEGLIHEDFASLGDDGARMAEVAGLLALLFGADGLEGAIGGQSETQQQQESVDDETDGDSDTSTESDDSGDQQTGEDDPPDDEFAGADGDSSDRTDEASGDRTDEESSDDGTAAGETDAGGEPEASLFDRIDPLTVGLLVGGLLAVAVGWIAYRTGRGVLGIVLSIPTLLFGAVTRFVFGITAIVERAARSIRAASSVFALPGLFVAGVVQSCRDLSASVRSLFDRGQPTVDAGGVEQLPSEREQIRAAWRSVIEAVGDRRYRRRTPGEIKRKAVDRGLPESPVATLVGVFRDVEYGANDPTDRAQSAVSAATELSEATETPETETPETETPETETAETETADSTDEPPTQTTDESTDQEATR